MRNQNPKDIILSLASREPLLRYKGDIPFSQWQKKSREKLSELLGLEFILFCDADLEITEETDCGDYTDTYFSFQSEQGYYVPCHILKPKNITGKIPLLICLQGHSTGMHISIGVAKFEGDDEDIATGDRDYARIAVKKGYCAITLEQRYMGECGGTAEGPGCNHHNPESANALPALLYGRTSIGERVHDVSRLIDIITSGTYGLFDLINADDIMITGNSGGGTTSFYAACTDERIKYCIPSCAVCTYKDSIASINHCACNFIPHIARFFDMGDLAGLIAPRALIISAGEKDSIFPIDGVKTTYEIAENLFKTADAEDKINIVIGNGGHRYYANLTFEILEKMRGQIL